MRLDEQIGGPGFASRRVRLCRATKIVSPSIANFPKAVSGGAVAGGQFGRLVPGCATSLEDVRSAVPAIGALACADNNGVALNVNKPAEAVLGGGVAGNQFGLLHPGVVFEIRWSARVVMDEHVRRAGIEPRIVIPVTPEYHRVTADGYVVTSRVTRIEIR